MRWATPARWAWWGWLVPGLCWAQVTDPPTALTQRNSDHSALCAGCTATQGTKVELSATTAATACDDTTLDLEVRPALTPFQGQATARGFVAKRGCGAQAFGWVALDGLSPSTAYKWQAREAVDLPSAWVPFNGGGIAFVTGPALATALVFTTAPQSVDAGACSPAVTIANEDGGTPEATDQDLPLDLSALPHGVSLFSDSQCTAPLSAEDIDAGTSAFTYFWQSTVSGAFAFRADAPGVLWGTQTETVLPGPPARLSVYLPSGVDAGQCLFGNVALHDQFGNPTAGPVDITLSLDGCGALYGDPECTQPDAGVTVAGTFAHFFWSGWADGVMTLSARAPGLTGGQASTTVSGPEVDGGCAAPLTDAGNALDAGPLPADAGDAPPGMGRLGVGCGCTSASAWFIPLLALGALLVRRRR